MFNIVFLLLFQQVTQWEHEIEELNCKIVQMETIHKEQVFDTLYKSWFFLNIVYFQIAELKAQLEVEKNRQQ